MCNSLDTLVIDRARLTDLPQICAPLAEKGVTIYADDEAFASLEGKYEKLEHATADDFGREWLDYKMSIKTVADIDEAIEFVEAHTSRHSESIVAQDADAIQRFCRDVDAACVYASDAQSWRQEGC